MAVIDSRPMPVGSATGEQGEQGENSSNHADDHQDDPHRVDIESVLIGSGSDPEIETYSDSKGDDARYHSSCHGFVPFTLAADAVARPQLFPVDADAKRWFPRFSEDDADTSLTPPVSATVSAEICSAKCRSRSETQSHA